MLLYHLGAITFANLHRSTVLGSGLHTWFSPYTSYLGLWQDWAMFTTIPYYASLTPVLEVETARGGKVDLGPMLPHLEAAPDSLRLTSLFGRLVWSRSSYAEHRQRYERTACLSVEKSTGTTPLSIRVRLEGQRLQRLDAVRSTGVSSYPQQPSSPAFRCLAGHGTSGSQDSSK